ncbi:elongation factor Ts [bacterium BMS3Abin05]|nr:elongation factor Ts [bacterium BMS3Abin05]GBE27696.1 elongation factor Ts [bacterium BMS3Bbin03]HDZ11563.1 translation elongation factor Ts [Bacteroidota bacterium]
MAVGANLVMELRKKTGAGIMDCKRALQEADGDMEKAIDYLRKKGIASAQKRSGRETKEGVVDAYIHPGNRIGVMVEVNCETDFVANTADFRQFVKNVAMQIAAANPLVVSREELSSEVIEKEKEIYREQIKESGKPDSIIDKIVEGKLEKYYQEVCLLEQNYIREPEKTIKDLLTEIISKIGENIIIRRFVRYQLGEQF